VECYIVAGELDDMKIATEVTVSVSEREPQAPKRRHQYQGQDIKVIPLKLKQ